MVHCYKNNGYNIVLDSNSGSVHAVDEVAFEVIDMSQEVRKKLSLNFVTNTLKLLLMILKRFFRILRN
jgi:hypothetical protein